MYIPDLGFGERSENAHRSYLHLLLYQLATLILEETVPDAGEQQHSSN